MGVYGFSSLISNYILLFSMNPDNIKAIQNPETEDYYFPKEIAERLPSALRTLSYYFLGVMILGNFLQFEYNLNSEDFKREDISQKLKDSLNNEEISIISVENDINFLNPDDETRCTSLIHALKSKAFYLIFIMTF